MPLDFQSPQMARVASFSHLKAQILEREGNGERTLVGALLSSVSLQPFTPVCLKAKLIPGVPGASKDPECHVSLLWRCICGLHSDEGSPSPSSVLPGLTWAPGLSPASRSPWYKRGQEHLPGMLAAASMFRAKARPPAAWVAMATSSHFCSTQGRSREFGTQEQVLPTHQVMGRETWLSRDLTAP